MTRAKAQGSSFAPDDENLAAVAAICRRLDGIPLAIELCRGACRDAQPAEDRNDSRRQVQIPTTGRRTALPSETADASRDARLSYDLLKPRPSARVLRQLGIFAGELLLDAAIAVSGEHAKADVDRPAREPRGQVARRRRHSRRSPISVTPAAGYNALLRRWRSCAPAGNIRRRSAPTVGTIIAGSFASAEAESELKAPQPEWLLSKHQLGTSTVRACLPRLGVPPPWWRRARSTLADSAAASPALGAVVAACLLSAASAPSWRWRGSTQRARMRTRLRMQLSAARGWSLMSSVWRRPRGRSCVGGDVAARGAARATATTRLRALWGLCIDQFNNGEFLQGAARSRNRFAEVVADSSNPVDRMMADRLLATALHFLGDQKLAHHHIVRTLLAPSRTWRRSLRWSAFGSTCAPRLHLLPTRVSSGCSGLAEPGPGMVARNVEEGRASGHALTFCSVLGQGACPITFLAGDLDAAPNATAHC